MDNPVCCLIKKFASIEMDELCYLMKKYFESRLLHQSFFNVKYLHDARCLRICLETMIYNRLQSFNSLFFCYSETLRHPNFIEHILQQSPRGSCRKRDP